MADNQSPCLVCAMDRLWFQHIILFSDPISQLFPKIFKPTQPISNLLTCPSSDTSFSLPDGEISSDSSPITPLDDSNNEEDEKEIINQKERRSKRFKHILGRNRSHSFSPSTHERSKKISFSGSERKLNKSMSCRSLGELEIEEVKGFMDLGFIFKKEHLSPRMMSVIPGLQRLRLHRNKQNMTQLNIDAADQQAEAKNDEIGEDEEERSKMRPYLSEAWLIKRPDSPLLNLRVPRISAAVDMKKHLRFWARTVASEIQQES